MTTVKKVAFTIGLLSIMMLRMSINDINEGKNQSSDIWVTLFRMLPFPLYKASNNLQKLVIVMFWFISMVMNDMPHTIQKNGK